MVKEILKWRDKKFDELVEKDDEKIDCAKAFGLGAVEGIIDAAVVVGAFAIVKGGIEFIKEIAKK